MLTVLQCTSAYPTPTEEANLTAMHTIADALDARIGFSDHTTGTLLAPVAVGMGASMIEKHFTLDRSLPGPDHQASLEPDELPQNPKTPKPPKPQNPKTPKPQNPKTPLDI